MTKIKSNQFDHMELLVPDVKSMHHASEYIVSTYLNEFKHIEYIEYLAKLDYDFSTRLDELKLNLKHNKPLRNSECDEMINLNFFISAVRIMINSVDPISTFSERYQHTVNN